MKYFVSFMLAVILNALAHASGNSQAISRILVGQWEWETNINGCHSLVSMAFRSNGTLTSTSESCVTDSDGFGLFSYGWYVANEHICFTDDERQYQDEKKGKSEYRKYFLAQVSEGYIKERCNWRIKSYSKKKIIIEVDNESFTMIRHRWL